MARPRVELSRGQRPEVALPAVLAVDPGGVVHAPDADAAALVFSIGVEAPPVGLDLGVEETLVGVAEALTPLARVGRDKFARPPELLVEHRTAFVAQGAARIVLALALVIL